MSKHRHITRSILTSAILWSGLVISFGSANAIDALGVASLDAFAEPAKPHDGGIAASPIPSHAGVADGAVGEAALDTYIVTFVEPGVLHYHGGVQGIPATAASFGARGDKLDVRAPSALQYRRFLASERAAHLSEMAARIGRALSTSHSYSVTRNGVSLRLTPGEAAAIVSLPSVANVRIASVEHPVTFRGPAFIGADKVWDGAATPTHVGTRGMGVAFGDLDGGTSATHPSFANDPACGFDDQHPKLIAVDCSSSDDGVCNGPNPEVDPGFGHGMHTASTAAGDTIDNTATPAPLLPDGITMSGVAPCASIHQYKVCQQASCDGDAILAGIENAIADQIDVLNFSISGGLNPWSDGDRDFLDAQNADIFVAAAAGNLQTGVTNPESKVNHLGPWLTTVAASSQDEVLSPALQVTGPGTPPLPLPQVSIIPSDTTTESPALDAVPIRSYPPNITGCTDGGGFPPDTFAGAVAVVERGATEAGGVACSFTEKALNAAAAGAAQVIIANNVVGTLSMTTPDATIPVYSVDKASGDVLIAFLADNESTAVCNIVSSTISSLQGDVLADFSYRGPTRGLYANETKPDITGPGVTIYAALDAASGNYGLDSGTSMSTPHIAGAAVLLRAVHPEWSAMEVKSALATTSTNEYGVREDGATPWTIDDVGSGRVEVDRAALAGLTLDETYDDFVAANPNGGTMAMQDLNLPHLRNVACTGHCTWTRVVRNRLDVTASWSATLEPAMDDVAVTVSPASFVLSAGDEQTLTITATPTADLAAIRFGSVVLHEANGLSPDQHLTFAVQGDAAVDAIFADGFE